MSGEIYGRSIHSPKRGSVVRESGCRACSVPTVPMCADRITIQSREVLIAVKSAGSCSPWWFGPSSSSIVDHSCRATKSSRLDSLGCVGRRLGFLQVHGSFHDVKEFEISARLQTKWECGSQFPARIRSLYLGRKDGLIESQASFVWGRL